MLRKLSLMAVLLLPLPGHAEVLEPKPTDSADYSQLATEIDRILQRTRTPGAAVALFEPDGSVWRYTTGLKNIERKEKVASDTIFRLGSISKMFVGLAVMKLVAAGELSLNDRLSELAPEVEFHNPWESEHPLRLIHLLNHSTGWDAPHSRELVGHAGAPLSIADSLALNPQSRYSRWVPGTRTAYNNTGPLVAAYIVEKITGEKFEDYIRQQFFDPLGMSESGYYFDDQYRSRAASLYRGRQALPYWHLPNRAAGGLHSSLDDMVRFVRFMQRPDQAEEGAVLGGNLVREMEQPSGTTAAAAGLNVGWGIGVTSFHTDGLVYYGHEGSLPGVSALVAYRPQASLGDIVLTNGDGRAASQIHRLLAEYTAAKLGGTETATEPAATPDPAIAGYYRLISPVANRLRIAASLMPWKITATEDSLKLAPLFGGKPRSLRVSEEGRFIQPETGQTAMVATDDPLAGPVLQYGPMTLKKTGTIQALTPLVLLIAWLIAVVVACLYLLIWLPRHLFRRNLSSTDIRLRTVPLLALAGIGMAAVGVRLISAEAQPYAAAASVTLPSLLVFLGPILFALGALWGLWVWKQCRASVTRGFGRWHATAMVFLNLAVSIYLLGYGLIGIRLWS
ncbi:serine hydrolase domain-containing protein [Microbulbifer hainanensis]|uniref:serine hydrolase domain-containing protein n=1 Tax=Microbulbifer hainanensis TaxID=2735675 RepID=UPI0018669FCE|nr:serine hydrolase domain-containing protein [Microbulbifer hainanensis]